jgi:hypothetical protein
MRGRRALDNALLMAAITASIWVVHGLELLTALVVAGALLAWTVTLALRASPRRAFLGIGLAVAAVAAGALVVTMLTRLPHVPPPAHSEPSAIAVATVSSPVRPHVILQYVVQTDLASPVVLGLVGVGLLALLIQRRMLWVLAALIAVLLVIADTLFWHHLAGLWRRFYPWGDTDRVLGVMYWIVPFIAGAGLLAIATLWRALARERRVMVGLAIAALALALVLLLARHPLGRLWADAFASPTVALYPLGVFDGLSQLRPWLLTIGVATAVLVFGWVAAFQRVGVPRAVLARLGSGAEGLDAAGAALAVVAVLCLALGARAELDVYRRAVLNRALVTPADMTVMTKMSSALPAGARILTDGGDDAGFWMAALTDLTPVVPNGFDGGPLSNPIHAALAHACDDPAAAEQALHGADAIFVGAHRLPAAQYPWSVDCIARLPGLRTIATSPWQGTEAEGFAVVSGR